MSIEGAPSGIMKVHTSSRSWRAGSNTGITSTPAALTATGRYCPQGVQIIAAAGNSQNILIGDAADNCVIPLAAGGSYLVPIDDPTKVFVQAASGTQTAYFVCH